MKARDRVTSSRPRSQYAALPWRRAGTVEIMLVSSRETKRWVMPKGWPMKGHRPHAAAAREAMEEAGIVGKIATMPVGTYHYMKRMKNGAEQLCRVTVFPFEVSAEHETWLEQDARVRRWFDVSEAAEAVDEPELRALIREFGAIADELTTRSKAQVTADGERLDSAVDSRAVQRRLMR